MPVEEVTPPKTDDAPKADTKAKRRATPGSAKLKEQVADLYATIGMVAIAPIDRLAGTLLVNQSEELAEQWIKLAETNPAVKRALNKLVEAGGWGGIIMAHGMIVLPVLANRGMFPDQAANAMAMVTVTQHPEVAPLFNHPRFSETATPVPNGNGNGSS